MNHTIEELRAMDDAALDRVVLERLGYVPRDAFVEWITDNCPEDQIDKAEQLKRPRPGGGRVARR